MKNLRRNAWTAAFAVSMVSYFALGFAAWLVLN